MTTGTAVTRIHVTRDGVTMGLGMATKDLTIDGAELQRIFLYIDDMQSFVLTAPLKLLPKGQCIVESRTERCVLDEFGNAQLGFTSSTRSEYPANHDIHSWSYCSQPNCGR